MNNDELLRELQSIKAQLPQAHAVFVGNNRLLIKTAVLELMFLLPADDLLVAPKLAMSGYFETEVTNFFLKNIRPEDHCLDIGANFGYYSCLMKRLANQGLVVGVEADPGVARLARDNLAINWMGAGVKILNLAAADQSGTLTLYRRDKRSGNTSIIRLDDASLDAMNEGPAQAFDIEARTIDSIVDDHLSGKVDFIKIDVEGAEPLVLKGLAKTLGSNPSLKIVMEWSPAQIAHAGFSVGDFISHLQRLPLSPARIEGDGSTSAVTWSHVAGLGYANLVLHRLS